MRVLICLTAPTVVLSEFLGQHPIKKWYIIWGLDNWIWYIFPQLKDLGRSPTAKHFGLNDIVEARDYIAHPLLGPRYLECCKALLLHRDKSVEAIIGGWVDKQKLRSSLTLMTAAGVGNVAEICLTLFYSDGRCELTERILKGSLEDY